MLSYKHPTRGFLLLELAFGMLLISFFSCWFALWHTGFIESQQHTILTLKALNRAASAIEEFKAFKKVPHNRSSIFTLSFDICPTEIASYVYATVTVVWQERDKKQSITLKTGIRI